jgi:hypothetical protein
MYHDVLRDADGRVVWDRGWNKNAIVVDCRRLLAGFMFTPLVGSTSTFGIQGLSVGQGSGAWDASGAPPPASTQTALVDPNPFLVPRASLQIDYLNGSLTTATPTNRLQIIATLGPNTPPWPDANHVSGNLREFGLVGRLNGANVLINYVTHPVIVKDPTSTLTRTIVLVF